LVFLAIALAAAHTSSLCGLIFQDRDNVVVGWFIAVDVS
jgi:hypothetical protein